MIATYDEVVSMVNIRSINFDTLKYANRLKAVGVPDKQAELQAELQAETVAQQTDAICNLSRLIDNNLATKQDINELKQDINELKQDVNELKLSEERTNKNIAQMGYKTMIVLVGVLGSMIAALGFLIKLN